MDAFKVATSKYLSGISRFTIDDLLSVFPWFEFNKKWMEEVLSFWTTNGYVRKEGDFYTPLNSSCDKVLVFLDVDGVLNHKNSSDALDTNCLLNLKRICEGRDALIILISSWKSGWFKDKTLKQDEDADYLDERLAEIQLSIYDKSSRYPGTRMLEVLDWVMKFNTDKYVILDDDWDHYKNTPLMDKLVPTDYCKGGLTEELADYAISILK